MIKIEDAEMVALGVGNRVVVEESFKPRKPKLERVYQ